MALRTLAHHHHKPIIIRPLLGIGVPNCPPSRSIFILAYNSRLVQIHLKSLKPFVIYDAIDTRQTSQIYDTIPFGPGLRYNLGYKHYKLQQK